MLELAGSGFKSQLYHLLLCAICHFLASHPRALTEGPNKKCTLRTMPGSHYMVAMTIIIISIGLS